MWHSRRSRFVRPVAATTLAVAFVLAHPARPRAADEWIEVRTPHFAVMSNAGDKATRRLAWQLEQVRSAMTALWSWAKPDLPKPLVVLALKDDASLRALAPQYWETRGTVRPASVLVTGPDRYYLAIITGRETSERVTLNPYLLAYSSYIQLVLDSSVAHPLPLWFSQGLTEVLGNTIVHDDEVLIGPPIREYLEVLADRPVLPLARLLAIDRESPEYRRADDRMTYDAESWALVHFLMFGQEGRYLDALSRYSTLVLGGQDAAAALTATIGPVEAFEPDFRGYLQRRLYTYRKGNIDVSVEREKLPVRTVPPAESWSARAMFQAVTGRSVEGRAAIAEARRADPAAAESFTAEGLLFDQEGKREEARAAYAKAADLGSANAFTYYRLATLSWQSPPTAESLAAIDAFLAKAISLNTRYAAAYAWLGEIRAYRRTGDPLGLVRRAITLEPRDSFHHVRAARVLLLSGQPGEAAGEASTARGLARTDDERRAADEMLTRVTAAPRP